MINDILDHVEWLRAKRMSLYLKRLTTNNRLEVDQEIRLVSDEINTLEKQLTQRLSMKEIAQRWHEQND